jgi:hypothetical protein
MRATITIAAIASGVLGAVSTRAATGDFEPWAASANAPPTPVELVPADSDHEEIRLRLGLGWAGRSAVPLGNEGARAAGDSLGVHVIGARVWFRQRVGIDLGFGAHLQATPRDDRTATGRGDDGLAFTARVGLPIALLITRHVTFFAGPAIGFGWAGETAPGRRSFSPITGAEEIPADTRHRGSRLSVGGRLGAEIHLGFVAMPRLSLITTVGLDADWITTSTDAPPAPTVRDPRPAAERRTQSRLSLRTTFADEPAVALLGNVALLAYF